MSCAFDQADSFERESKFALPSWPQVTFEEQAARLMGDVQKAQLARLEDFSIGNSEEFPFPDRFLESLAGFVRSRSAALCGLDSVDRGMLREKAEIARSRREP